MKIEDTTAGGVKNRVFFNKSFYLPSFEHAINTNANAIV
jgi:hypothetical protein